MSELPAPSFRGRIHDGKIELRERSRFAGLIAALDGYEIVLTLKKYRKTRSLQQNKYLWGVVYPIFAEHLGYEREELHDAMRMLFLRRHEEKFVTVASTTSLNTLEMTEYIENIRRLAAEDNCYIPDPE